MKKFLEYLLFLSLKDLLSFSPEFIKYISKIWKIFNVLENKVLQDIFGFIEHLKFNDYDILDSSKLGWDQNSLRVLTIHASKGLEAVSGLSFLVDNACIALKPPIPEIVIAASEPPVTIISQVPNLM